MAAQTIPVLTLAKRPSVQHRDVQIQHIKQEIDHMNRIEAYAAARKCVLKKRLNSVQSLTHKFPLEVLTLIFQLLCSSHRPGHNPFALLVLGAVCSHWRQAVHSNFQFWTSMHFTISPSKAERIGKFLCLSFKNSAERPLTLNLRFVDRHLFMNDLVHSGVDSVIKSNLHRIRCLELNNPPKAWWKVPPHLFLLTYFSVTVNSAINNSQSNPVRPNLRFLSGSTSLRQLNFLSSIAPSGVEVPSEAALTHVDVTDIGLNRCIDMLIRFPNLIIFRQSGHLTIPTEDAGLLMRGPELIVRDKVRIFCWGLFNHLDNYRLLLSIRFPSIHCLGWYMPIDCDELATAAGDTFLRNLPHTLAVLQLHDGIRFPRIQPLLNRRSIKHLILTNLGPETLSYILCRKPGKNIFPGLEKLTIKMPLNGPIPGYRRVSQQVTRMLMALFCKQNTRKFCLETFSFPVKWTDESKYMLRGLVDDGMKLEIDEDSRPVSWLKTRRRGDLSL